MGCDASELVVEPQLRAVRQARRRPPRRASAVSWSYRRRGSSRGVSSVAMARSGPARHGSTIAREPRGSAREHVGIVELSVGDDDHRMPRAGRAVGHAGAARDAWSVGARRASRRRGWSRRSAAGFRCRRATPHRAPRPSDAGRRRRASSSRTRRGRLGGERRASSAGRAEQHREHDRHDERRAAARAARRRAAGRICRTAGLPRRGRRAMRRARVPSGRSLTRDRTRARRRTIRAARRARRGAATRSRERPTLSTPRRARSSEASSCSRSALEGVALVAARSGSR